MKIFKGALVYKSTNQYVVDEPPGTWHPITWDLEVYDTNNIHDKVANNERLIVPSGIKKIKLSTFIVWNEVKLFERVIRLRRNGGAFIGSSWFANDGKIESRSLYAQTPVIPVVAGDYFTVEEIHMPGGVFITTESWFSMEIIE